MIDDVLVWHAGATRTMSASVWAGICSTFLGAGFRVDLPGGALRAEAAHHEHARVREVAKLLGAPFNDVAWTSVVDVEPEADVEIVGGWPRNYDAAPALWVTARRVDAEPDLATGTLLSERVHPSPTTGLPMFSRLRDAVALSTVAADCGIWADPDGGIVTSTAGPIIAERVDGTWATGSASSTWLATRIALQRGASGDLHVDDLASVRSLGVVRRARDLQSLTYLG